MKLTTQSLAVSVALGFAVVVFRPAIADTLNIYVSPKGNDQADGASARHPVATLNRVQELVAEKAKGHDEVQILFANGTYRKEAVTWTTFPGIWVRFMPANKDGSVIFDGQKSRQPVFFKVKLAPPDKGLKPLSMKLDFRGLTIRNYCEGISLQSWNDKVRTMGGTDNRIEGNTFENIGSKYDPVIRNNKPRGGCTAALRLQGVGNNVVKGNTFRHIVNLPANRTDARRYGPGHLHAIYISNMSLDNQISENYFDDFSGDPIRVRDKSDRNKIFNNEFGSTSAGIKPGSVHAISQWYCNKNVRACIEEHADRKECLSTDLRISDNRIKGPNVAGYADRSQGPATCAN